MPDQLNTALDALASFRYINIVELNIQYDVVTVYVVQSDV